MTQLEAKRINNVAFLTTSVGPRFKSWWAHPPHAVELVLLGTSFLPASPVTFAVTTGAKRYQVVYHIGTKPAPWSHVMDSKLSMEPHS